MAEILAFANQDERQLDPPSFILTQGANAVLQCLNLLGKLDGPRIAMISGPSGIGKTTAAKAFFESHDTVEFITCTSGEDTPKHLAETLSYALEVQETGNMTLGQRRRAISSRLRGYRIETIVLDNAHHLLAETVSWATTLAWQSECDIAFIGSSVMESTFLANEQLDGSAIKVALRGISAGDIADVARSHGLDRDGIPAQLEAIGQQNGHLRKVMAAIEFARGISANGNPSLDDIVGAIKHLGFKKGVK